MFSVRRRFEAVLGAVILNLCACLWNKKTLTGMPFEECTLYAARNYARTLPVARLEGASDFGRIGLR